MQKPSLHKIKSGLINLSLFIALALFVVTYIAIQLAVAESNDARGRLSTEQILANSDELRFPPLSLAGGSSLTLFSPQEWGPVGTKLTKTLESAHQHFSILLGDIPSIDISLRLMPEESFYQNTGAPRWTNALYYRNQIIIPMPNANDIDMDNISRSIRHEYTHAIIHALSAGRCPGWLDEGLAQWAEGNENPALRPALSYYLQSNPPVPLSMLQGGFTRLDRNMVAAAYAQSLIATHALMQTFGFPAIRHYFNALKNGSEKRRAFSNSFRISEGDFEERLDGRLLLWSKVSRPNSPQNKDEANYDLAEAESSRARG